MSLVVNAPAGKMKELLEKIRTVEREIAGEKGGFLLFALLLREDAPDVWDLLVSAPWMTQEKKVDTLDYIIAKLHGKLRDNELLKLSHIVIIQEGNPGLDALQAIHIEGGIAELKDIEVSGLPIKHAYLITSRKNAKPSGPPPDGKRKVVKTRYRGNSK